MATCAFRWHAVNADTFVFGQTPRVLDSSNSNHLGGNSRPTLRMIAMRLGVSHATVSMALRNHPRITTVTRQRVQSTAAQLGYRPDPQVGKLMHQLRVARFSRSSPTLAAITNHAESDEPCEVTSLCRGAQRAAESLGYRLEVFRVNVRNRRCSSLQRLLNRRGVEGVLLLPMVQPVALNGFLDWSSFSVVATSYRVLAPEFHRVTPDPFGNTLLLCQRLIAQGYRRVGLVTANDAAADQRASAVMMSMNALGEGALTRPLITLGNNRAGLRAWFEQQRPDAIITATENEAQAIAEELNLPFPAALGFALSDQGGSTRYSGVDQRLGAIGAASVQQLHATLLRGEKGVPDVPSVMTIKGEWVEVGAVANASSIAMAS
jgi:DNA-binding LacI/PurR family transcriptional regulator